MLLAELTLLLLTDVAVPAKGPVMKGDMTVDKSVRTLALAEKLYMLEDLLLVEKDDGKLIWAASFQSRLRGYERLYEVARRGKIVKLLKEALRTRDPILCREIYDAAQRGGWTGIEETRYRKRVERLEKKPPTRIKAQKATEVRKQFREMGGGHADLLLARAELEPAEGARMQILAEALRIAPSHAAAGKRLREWVPDDNPFETPRDYLTWLARLKPLGFRLVENPVELKRQRHQWRPDLYAIRTDDMLVLTPIKQLKVLQPVLGRAHLALQVLKKMFHTDQPVARSKKPLLLFIYGNKHNFIEQRRYRSAASVPPFFRFDQGHFDRRDNVGRFLGDVSGLERRYLYWIIKHEIVRHWLWTKNPRYSSKQVLGSLSNPGYWVVPGLAHFIADSQADLDALTLDFRTKDLDPVRLIARTAPLEWREFLMNDREDVNRMKGKRGKLLTSWYYANQAGVLCRYLWSRERGRKQLADYLSNYYAGETVKLNPKTAFGMGAIDLGAAVVAYTRR